MVLAALVAVSAGCGVVKDVVKSGANSVGMYDYPVVYKANTRVSPSESWRALFEVKPAAVAVVERAVNLARVRSQPGQEENNEFLALAKLDVDHDRVITASEASESAGLLIQEVADAMGEDLRIDDGTTVVVGEPVTTVTVKK
jgi:hypothetical protein